jgi:hypothetical protein
LTKKKFTYVKNEGANLNTMTITLKPIVSCEALGVIKSFQGVWFEHAFSKACQYVDTKEKNFQGLEICFLLNLFMWIFKNVLHGLKSQGKEDMNG